MSQSSHSRGSDVFRLSNQVARQKEPLFLVIDENLRPLIGGRASAQASANAAGAFRIEFEDIGVVESGRVEAPSRRAVIAVGSEGSRASLPVTILTG